MIRHAVAWVLHPRRHRRAKHQIQRIGYPRRIAVLCHGNMCRSPYLEALVHRLLPNVVVSSAGFSAAGRPVPQEGLTVAARRGVDLSDHRSRLITPDMLGHADLVLVMDARQARFVATQFHYPTERVVIAGDLDPVRGEPRTIRDPWRESIEVFEATFTRLERCAESLASILYDEAPKDN